MDASTLQSELEEKGEIMVKVAEFDEPVELHVYDTNITDDVIEVDMADGDLMIDVDEVIAVWTHMHHLEDFGL